MNLNLNLLRQKEVKLYLYALSMIPASPQYYLTHSLKQHVILNKLKNAENLVL